MYQSEPLHLTANFYLPNENGPDVILEVVTKENPMTIERSRKSRYFDTLDIKSLSGMKRR